MSEAHVLYTASAPVAVITLNRPEARNAYSDRMLTELCNAFDAADADDNVRAVILTGAGTAFHAGGDLKQMAQHEGMFAGDPVRLRKHYVEGIQRIPRRIAHFDKPLIAAINGPAIGAGLDLACMCDLRIAATGTRMGSTFVKVGLVPGDGGAYFLTRTVGFSRALELMLTGRLVDTAQALAMGLIHEEATSAELMPRARALAETIAANAPLAVRLTKRAAYESLSADLDRALALAAAYQGMVQNTADHQTAVQALLRKETPTFAGR